MVKRLDEVIEIPSGITASIDEFEITLKKDDKVLKRKFSPLLDVKVEGSKMKI